MATWRTEDLRISSPDAIWTCLAWHVALVIGGAGLELLKETSTQNVGMPTGGRCDDGVKLWIGFVAI